MPTLAFFCFGVHDCPPQVINSTPFVAGAIFSEGTSGDEAPCTPPAPPHRPCSTPAAQCASVRFVHIAIRGIWLAFAAHQPGPADPCMRRCRRPS